MVVVCVVSGYADGWVYACMLVRHVDVFVLVIEFACCVGLLGQPVRLVCWADLSGWPVGCTVCLGGAHVLVCQGCTIYL